MSTKADTYYSPIAEKLQNERKKSRSKGRMPLWFRHIFRIDVLLWLLCGFFLGKAIILGELFPFLPAYALVCAVSLPGISGIIALGVMGFSLAGVCSGLELMANIISVTGIYSFAKLMPQKYLEKWQYLSILVFAVSLSLKASFFGLVGFNGGDSLIYINLIFESLIASLLTPVLLFSQKSFKISITKEPIKTEEVIYLLILLGGIIAGSSDIKIASLEVKAILSNLVILLCALVGGAGMGAMGGALMGVIPGLSFVAVPSLLGAYAFFGVISGLGKGLGKKGVCLGFLLANIILWIYVNDLSQTITILGEILIAFLIFSLISPKFIQRLTSLSPGLSPMFTEEIELKMRSTLQDNIHNIGGLFKEIGKVFQVTYPDSLEENGDKDLEIVLEEVRNKVCLGCGMYRICWEKSFHVSTEMILEMLSLVQNFGRITTKDIPGEMQRRCTRPKELVIAVSCMYNAYSLNRFWTSKMLQNRKLLNEQLDELSKIMDEVGEKVGFSGEINQEMENLCRQVIRENGFYAYKVKGFRFDQKTEIVVSGRSCLGTYDCRYKVSPVISKLLNDNFRVGGCLCLGDEVGDICTFRVYQGLNFDVQASVAVSKRKGYKVSGDSYCFAQLKNGKFVAILSDGMGSGEEAFKQSSAVISMLKRLLDFGFSAEEALKTVNSVLMLKMPDENFCTIDLALIDLYSGKGEIMKIASPPSYFIRGNKVTYVEGNTLPVGIIQDIQVSCATKSLEAGDIIVMVTDGILESNRFGNMEEDWILNVLQGSVGLGTDELAQLLLDVAQNSGAYCDDMTVLVLKIVKFDNC